MYVTIEDYLHRAKDWPESHNLYPMDQVGYYMVYGEDPNPDMGGHHSQPFLGMYHGTFRRVLDTALSIPEFVTWGAGGNIKKVHITEV